MLPAMHRSTYKGTITTVVLVPLVYAPSEYRPKVITLFTVTDDSYGDVNATLKQWLNRNSWLAQSAHKHSDLVVKIVFNEVLELPDFVTDNKI
jgi:hypothetical protein